MVGNKYCGDVSWGIILYVNFARGVETTPKLSVKINEQPLSKATVNHTYLSWIILDY